MQSEASSIRHTSVRPLIKAEGHWPRRRLPCLLQHHPFSEVPSVITSASKITSNCPGGQWLRLGLPCPRGHRSNPWCRKTPCPRGSLALASQLLRSLCPKARQLQLLQPPGELLEQAPQSLRSATKTTPSEKPPSTASRENPRAATKTQPKPTARTKKTPKL